jgi:uncharacterized Tic20 family protein
VDWQGLWLDVRYKTSRSLNAKRERLQNMDTPPQMNPPSAAPDRTWDVLCHIAALAGFVVPFGNILGPLILWLIKRQEIPSVDAHGKESLNFQISVTIYLAVAAVLMLVLIGFFLMIGIAIASIVLVVIAAVKASNGELYRYPLTIRFIN